MQDLLLGTLGTKAVALVSRYPWPAGVLVASLIVIDLLRRNRSSTGADIDLGMLGDDGGGD